MKICVYGAGAIGGVLGAKLALAGHEVTMVARGAHLAAMQRDGVILQSGGETVTAPAACIEDPAQAGPQDVVVVTVKAPALPDVLGRLGPLLGPDTAVVTAMNGLPWWFFEGLGGEHDGRRLDCLDPGGALARAVPAERIIGCVLHVAASVPEPGHIRHVADDRFLMGEPSGEKTARCTALADAITGAGLRGIVVDDIRQEYWTKLLGNFNFGPISVLTGGTNEQIAFDPEVRHLCFVLMDEAAQVGERLGLTSNMSPEERIDLGGSLGAFKTSMLQDYERGRPMEIDSIVRSVTELGRVVDLPTPVADAVLALLAQKARLAGLY